MYFVRARPPDLSQRDTHMLATRAKRRNDERMITTATRRKGDSSRYLGSGSKFRSLTADPPRRTHIRTHVHTHAHVTRAPAHVHAHTLARGTNTTRSNDGSRRRSPRVTEFSSMFSPRFSLARHCATFTRVAPRRRAARAHAFFLRSTHPSSLFLSSYSPFFFISSKFLRAPAA